MEARIGTSVILLNDKGEVLIGKRKGSHGEGLYSIPGGHLEYGETYNECCDRELMEEIGANFGEYEKVGFTEDFFGEKQYTTLYFVVRNIKSDIEIKNMEPDKCEGWEWVHVSKLSPVMFCDTYNQIKKSTDLTSEEDMIKLINLYRKEA